MAVSAVKNTMFYCPKCQQTYEDAVQRFCLNDGRRLLPASSTDKSVNQTSEVFTNILNHKAGDEDDKFSSAPNFSKTDRPKFFRPEFRPPADSSIFKPETEIEYDENIEPQTVTEFNPPISEPAPELIDSYEIPASQLQPDDKDTKPNERFVSESESSNALLGQIVKGRYQIIEQISEDEISSAFLAEDKFVADKKVIVRVLMDEDTDDDFSNKIFAEERVSLAHVNHPNIVNVFDSGELPEGKPFIVGEYVKGESVKDYLEKLGQFNALRTAGIIQQASYALSEIHKIGILHRNLKPENLILIHDESGEEQVKLTNFVASKDRLDEKNLAYKSPEQVEGKLANFASDSFSLAVIAYQMLTNRLPFNAASVGELLKAQREGMTLRPTNFRLGLPPLFDKILEKALAFNPSERYLNVLDFGDAFFSAISGNELLETDKAKKIEVVTDKFTDENSIPEPSSPLLFDANETTSVKSIEIDSEIQEVETTEDLAWEKRSPVMPNEAATNRNLFSILAVAALLLILWAAWTYFLKRPNETEFVAQTPTENVNFSNQSAGNFPPIETNINAATTPQEIESVPPPRTIMQPPGTVYFQNKKEDLRGALLRNYLGFSLYHPQDWKRNQTSNKFLDISKNASTTTPIEQILIGYYDSKGTFKDDAEIFKAQVKETNNTLNKLVPNYKMISEGEKTINNGWRAYEIKFQGTGRTANGDKVTLWGRRLFIPVAMPGMKNGYVITMLATSLSKEVKNVDDVGVKGELSTVLETFEPNQSY